MEYLKIWTNFREVISMLKDDEKGRLFDMMLQYAKTGVEPEEFIGNEVFLWPTAKRDIDQARAKSETNSENGKKGGRPPKDKGSDQEPTETGPEDLLPKETEENRNKPTETDENQEEANERRKEKKRKEMKGNEKKDIFLPVEDAREIQSEQDNVLTAAANSGFGRSDAVRAKLIALYADYGMEKMLYAIDQCVQYGAVNIAYLTSVLKGDGKKPEKTEKSRVKTVIAQQYTQRDYDGEQEDVVARMMEKYRSEELRSG